MQRRGLIFSFAQTSCPAKKEEIFQKKMGLIEKRNWNELLRRRAAGYQAVIPENPKGLSGI